MLFVAKATALFALVAFTRADIVITNFQVVGNGSSTVQWSSSDPDTDPVSFTIELANPVFNTQFGLGNNIPTSDGQITFETPSLIPGPNYAFRFVSNSNATDILAQTQPFTIQEHDVSSSTQPPLTGTTSISVSTLSQSPGVSTTGASGAASGSSNPSVTTPAPLSSSTNPSTTGSSTNSPSMFGGGGGGNAAGSLNTPAMIGVSAAAAIAGFAAIVFV